MEMRWAPAPAARARAPRQRMGADQPSFSSSLLDAICDSMDDSGPGAAPRGTATASACAAARTTTGAAAAAKKQQQQQEAALHYYYYRPSLAASHRARAAPALGATAADCSGRGYFSSSEVEYSLRRLRPIRTSGGGVPTQKQQQQQHQPAEEKKARTKKPAASASGCRRPASPGARIASLLNSIFSGKRPSAQRTAPADQEPVCWTVPSYERSCLPKTPPSARPSRSRSTRTVRFLDIDGEVAVAAAAVGRCRRIPVMEVEEVLLRPVDVEAESDGGEKSSDASSDLFELDNLAAIDPASGGGTMSRRAAYGDELPVYGTTGIGLRRGIGHVHPYEYGLLGRSCRKVA